ncbi:MAG: hypothetical protein EBW87_02120 [Burkholderiaceae bacterium]|nr:hypothetical protein [Burkholderiaceae bacterium]
MTLSILTNILISAIAGFGIVTVILSIYHLTKELISFHRGFTKWCEKRIENPFFKFQDIIEFEKWIQALRSGEYKQATNYLQTDYGYCCVGVACKVTIPEKKQKMSEDTNLLYGRGVNHQPHAPKWLRVICSCQYPSDLDTSLYDLNDIHRKSFEEIADILESTYGKLVFLHYEHPMGFLYVQVIHAFKQSKYFLKNLLLYCNRQISKIF